MRGPRLQGHSFLMRQCRARLPAESVSASLSQQHPHPPCLGLPFRFDPRNDWVGWGLAAGFIIMAVSLLLFGIGA